MPEVDTRRRAFTGPGFNEEEERASLDDAMFDDLWGTYLQERSNDLFTDAWDGRKSVVNDPMASRSVGSPGDLDTQPSDEVPLDPEPVDFCPERPIPPVEWPHYTGWDPGPPSARFEWNDDPPHGSTHIDWEVFTNRGNQFHNPRPCWPEARAPEVRIPPLASILRLPGRQVATVPLNPPVVGQFPTECSSFRTRDHDSLNPDSVYQEYFLDWVLSAWHMLWLGMELVDAAMRINIEFEYSIYDDRRELVKNIIRGTVRNSHRSTIGVSWDEFRATTPQQFIEPKTVNTVYFDPAGSGSTTKRCYTIRELHIHPVCNPRQAWNDTGISPNSAGRGFSADGKTYWPEALVNGDTQRAFSIALFFQGNEQGADDPFWTFVHGVRNENSTNNRTKARAETDATCATVWLASMLFHELLHVVKLPYNDEAWNTTVPHEQNRCDLIWISTNTLAQLLMRRYSKALDCPACTDQRTDMDGREPPLFHDGVDGHSFRSGSWRAAPWVR